MSMECSSKQRGDSFWNLDRFSSLQVELIHKILKLVPVRDAVRTSALSRFWRSIWMSIPYLVFDAHSIPTKLKGNTQTNRVDFVTHVLILHSGEISRFEIRNYLVDNDLSLLRIQHPDIDRWIIIISRKKVQELILHFPSRNGYIRPYRLPSAIFSCQQLRFLDLHHCVLNLPYQTKGFSNLKSLRLCYVKCTDETVASIISNSPLQNLVLDTCNSLTHLNICAPDLSYVCIFRCKGVNIGNTPKLSTAVMGSRLDEYKLYKEKRLEDFLGGLVNIQELTGLSCFIQTMTGCIVPERLCLTFYRLRYILLFINLKNSKELSTALCLFRSSPCLETLTITCNSYTKEEETSEVQLHKDEVLFPSLNTAKLTGFNGTEYEMRFAQSILLNAMVLHTLTIYWESNVVTDAQQKAHVMEVMNRFQRASPRAEVIFSDKE